MRQLAEGSSPVPVLRTKAARRRCPFSPSIRLVFAATLGILTLAGCGSDTPTSSIFPIVVPPNYYRIDEYPSWGPGDSLVAFHRIVESSLGPPGLYVMQLGGASRHVAAGDGLWPMDVAFSPSGDHIAAVWYGQLELVDVDTGVRRSLFYTDNLAFRPSWSPDSRYIAYARAFLDHGEPPDSSGIHLYDLQDNVDRPILSGSGEPYFGDFPRWNAAGTRIVASDGRRIFTFAPDGTGYHQLTAAPPAINHDYPRWLPTSDRILFEETRPTRRGLFTVREDDVTLRAWRPFLGPNAVINSTEEFAIDIHGVAVGDSLHGVLVLIRLSDGAIVDTLTEYSPMPASL